MSFTREDSPSTTPTYLKTHPSFSASLFSDSKCVSNSGSFWRNSSGVFTVRRDSGTMFSMVRVERSRSSPEILPRIVTFRATSTPFKSSLGSGSFFLVSLPPHFFFHKGFSPPVSKTFLPVFEKGRIPGDLNEKEYIQ